MAPGRRRCRFRLGVDVFAADVKPEHEHVCVQLVDKESVDMNTKHTMRSKREAAITLLGSVLLICLLAYLAFRPKAEQAHSQAYAGHWNIFENNDESRGTEEPQEDGG
jgi:hypothetical protein